MSPEKGLLKGRCPKAVLKGGVQGKEQHSLCTQAGQAGGTQGRVDPRQGGPWALRLCKAAQAGSPLPKTSLTHPMRSWPRPGF